MDDLRQKVDELRRRLEKAENAEAEARDECADLELEADELRARLQEVHDLIRSHAPAGHLMTDQRAREWLAEHLRRTCG